ncbi:MAG: ATP-binding cassette domain-containing protein, partial [Planctomycetota bacterium]
YNTILLAMAGGERIFKLLDTEPEVVDTPRAEPLARTDQGARIEFQNVTFSYRPDRPVLRDLSFTCEPGQVVALVGHTGSGKTTIVSLLGRLYEHQQGRILIDGHDIDAITLESLHAQMSLVLQENFLFTGTVMENIRFGKPGASDQDVEDACRALDCLDVFEQLPGGLHFNAGERGDNLSLGQRQLACFARAWLANPRIFMLDEATSAVDTHTEHRLQTALERLMAGRTTFVVAHRLSTIRRADLILVLEHGELIERGTHTELLESGKHYADLYTEFVRLSRGR